MDRGALDSLTFRRCAKGFVLQGMSNWEEAKQNGMVTTYAFDRIEDLAAWLVEQYGPSLSTSHPSVIDTTPRCASRDEDLAAMDRDARSYKPAAPPPGSI